MAGGGFASHAMNVVKANRALLNKRKRLKREDFVGTKTKTQIKAKETTPGQLRAVRLKLAANKRRELKIWSIAIVVAFVILYGLWSWMTV